MSSPPIVTLAIVQEPQSLGFLASDGRSFGVFERLALPDAGLAAALARWALDCAELPDPAERGARFSHAWLPLPVQHWLARQPEAVLQLQITEPLAALPWELAVVAGRPLDAGFTVVRQLMGSAGAAAPPGQRPAGPRLAVLRVDAAEGSVDALPAPPRPAAVQLQRVPRPAAAAGTDDSAALATLAALAGQADVLWWAAPLPDAPSLPGWLAALGAQPAAPRLLLASLAPGHEGHAAAQAWVAAACRAGFSAMLVPVAAPLAEVALAPFWQALAEGLCFGEAARRLRCAAVGTPALASAAQAWFHGDGLHAPCVPEAPQAPDDDVRQCTMLKCDLVDSTRQMGQLGDEAYAERLAQYHARVAAIVREHGGQADDPQGDDGFMCYFGHPVAREDAPAQALRAGLALVQAVAALAWQVRIGISTGRVVVKDGQPVGSAIHHAARLQALAAPGTVLVAASTQGLTTEGYEFTLVDPDAQLKGFEQGGAVWRLERERPAQGTERFDARSQLTRFVGREDELALLQRSWQATSAGRPQALMLTGEAGIGKSRLVREFRRQLAERGVPVLECRCAPEHRGSALQPVIELLRRQLHLAGAENPSAALERLRRSGLATLGGDEALALAADLLSLPADGLPPVPADAALRRQRTMALLVQWLRAGAANRPMVLIVEDVHWIDPSTRELVASLLDGRAATPLLLLLTLRSGSSGGVDADESAGFGQAVPRLALGGLPPGLAFELMRDACGAALLDAEAERWLAMRADGVPLFIEESARMAAALVKGLSAGAPGSAGHGPDIAMTLREAVPATLEGLLTARLDQLPSARRAAQLGSAIGRSFSRALAEAVNAHAESPIRQPDLAHELGVLVQAGLVSVQQDDGLAIYTFKHALVRDAAHQSLLERDRRRLHAAIADVLATQFTAQVGAQPELLAHHHELAGQVTPALAGWERAARHAAGRSAHDEAIGHLRHALALLLRQPDDAGRSRTELRLQLLLAGRLIATAGYGADAVEAVYGRALALCAATGDVAALAKVRLGLEGWHFMRGDFTQALAIAQQVDDDLGPPVPGQDDRLARIQSRWATANIVFHQGDLRRAVAMMDACLADYRQLGHRAMAVQDPGVMCLCYSAWGLWELGRADEALARARAVVDLAEGLNHRFSMGEAYGFLAVVHWFRGEITPGLVAARRAIEICESGGFAVWLAHARVVHGRLVAERGGEGDIEAGIEEMRQGDAMWAATGAVVTRAFYLSLRAEGLAQAGRQAEALALLRDAWALVERSGERYWAPELARAIGQLLLQRADGVDGDDGAEADSVAASDPQRAADRAEGERWLAQALDEARAKGLDALALRAAMAQGRRLAAQGCGAQARALLQPALAALAEGQATRDLRTARALLASC
ncbi:ATP-binding protein [Aquabacterium sp. OR-4]|uniref:ATP-binding protein n=1 Tax=Aquabacterium sp. OR-4 TaxID=2978127 RepID=UPI0028C71017|nr:AAA family ATPase [Aquabacterium sp. OR-4]MDT7833650.1 AAA family ATPase [Aquabacterium sp. OR-4]